MKKTQNIACNLIYNDGHEGVYVGFEGSCTIESIIYNVKKGPNRWCSQDVCSCKQYFNMGFKTKPITTFPCDESGVFSKNEWSAGQKFSNQEPFSMLKTGEGKYAILTTVFPNTNECERKIVGLMRIDNFSNDKNRIKSNKNNIIRLKLEEAKSLSFWAYYKNTNKPSVISWSQPRFRYLEDIQVALILHELKEITQNVSTIEKINKILKNDYPSYYDEKPNFKGAIENQNVFKRNLVRKYGQGGESLDHKRLKEYVSKHPELVGLNKTTKVKVEHSFISGDMVDILFTDHSKDVVVEIELDNVIPGIHQAIKYRALRCSQRGLKLDSKLVETFVVAWSFSKSEMDLCKKYGINILKLKL